ncbi:MAG: methyltransferase [Proteobacteria bacterium]|nr:MAG: methyltransferase [Pseudomonadota bacterium]
MLLTDRFLALQDVLAAHAEVWRPRPFCVESPDWVFRHPALAQAVLALDETDLARRQADEAGTLAWVATYLPPLAALGPLAVVEACERHPLPACDAHFDWAIPGRKRDQIEAFAAAVGPSDGPVLEWCAGKGHLGRRLATAGAVTVTSLEIDPVLSAESRRLAQRSGRTQHSVCLDALSAAGQAQVAGRHVVALHACGELHRSLVRRAGQGGATAFSIAPCCYDRGVGERYQPLAAAATLALDAGDLRLALAETVTASGRERRQQAQGRAFKLGFIALRQALEGTGYRAFRPVPAAWGRLDFEGFCRHLAAREAVTLPAVVHWDEWLATGWRRQAQVARYELVRHVFRRALELWLVGDLALGLASAGYRVRLGQFCERTLTPRNLLLQATQR